MRQIFFRILLVIMFAASINGDAQTKTKADQKMDMDAFYKMNVKFVKDRVGETFVPIDEWPCTDGSTFDMNKVTTPTVLYLGFYGCAPCRSSFPILNQLACEEKYKSYNFIYMTFDDSLTLSTETKALVKTLCPRLKLVPSTEKYIRGYKMLQAYPTVYFINSDKTVMGIKAYGGLEGDIDSLQFWHQNLDRLK